MQHDLHDPQVLRTDLYRIRDEMVAAQNLKPIGLKKKPAGKKDDDFKKKRNRHTSSNLKYVVF